MLREQDLKSGAAWNLSRAQSLAPENITNWSVFAWDPVKETPRAATSTSLASWNRDWQIGILYQNDGVCPERTFIVCSFPFPPTYAKHICLSSVILPIVRLLNTTHIRHGAAFDAFDTQNLQVITYIWKLPYSRLVQSVTDLIYRVLKFVMLPTTHLSRSIVLCWKGWMRSKSKLKPPLDHPLSKKKRWEIQGWGVTLRLKQSSDFIRARSPWSFCK